jgi:nucleoside-diphosphate-sugar epimerase
MRVILVTGAGSIVGRYLLPLLAARGYSVIAVSRQAHAPDEFATWVRADIATGQLPPEARRADTLIHLAPLPLSLCLLGSGNTCTPRRVVAVGTTSVFTKADSRALQERSAISAQRQAEQALVQCAQSLGFHWTLLRPTLVYDGMHDKNIAHIVRFITKFGFFPVVKPALGMRQPLHAADLAEACMGVLDKPETEARTYNLAGGQVLSYRSMVEEIFLFLGKKPRIIPVQPWAYRAALAMLSRHPHYRYMNSEMGERMNMDMVFDISAAQRDFGFSPRLFQPY